MGTVVPCQVGFTKKLLLLTGHFPFRQKTAKYPTWRHDMKKDTNLLDTQDVRAEAATALTPNATNGEKIKALRTAQGMSMAELSRRASIEHPINVSHSPDIAQSFGSLYYFLPATYR